MESGVGAVNFAPSAAELTIASKESLNKLAALAKVCASMHIEGHVHTDASGSEKANKRISQRRAQAVAAYLIGAGVESYRVHPIGHGSASPITSNDTAESRALNRRIELMLSDRVPGPALSAIAR
jgi:outer membrane protein OmpA-like peptidoglycan-associated protein